MAWQDGEYFEAVFVFVDVNGQKTRTSCNVMATTFEFADAKVREIATAMQDISEASMVEYSLTRRSFEDDAAVATGQGEDKAFFSFVDAGYPPAHAMVNVPGCPLSILQENVIDINLENADVAAFVTAFWSADGNGSQVVSARGEILQAVPEAAYLSQRRSLTRPSRRAG